MERFFTTRRPEELKRRLTDFLTRDMGCGEADLRSYLASLHIEESADSRIASVHVGQALCENVNAMDVVRACADAEICPR